MTLTAILLSADFLTAILAYVLIILISLPLMERVHAALDHGFLVWQWNHIAIPLVQAAAMLAFILLAYPVIFGIGIGAAPEIGNLLSREDLRLDHLINALFLISLLFPLIPVIGGLHELILPLQGIAASMMIFSWLADSSGLMEVSYWPGWQAAAICLLVALATHRLAVNLSYRLGNTLDRAFNVTDTGDLIARACILLMQSPVILIYSKGIGGQLTTG